MKKAVLLVLLFGIISCLALLFITYGTYKENLILKRQLSALKSDIKKQNSQLEDIPQIIDKLKEEQESLKKQKEEQIKQYEKWTRQNQILEDLLN
jgi:cell division protein FtsL